METRIKRIGIILSAVVFSMGIGAEAYAEDFISANDLPVGAIVSATDFEGFTIIGSGEKGVTIEKLDVAREAADGEVFNARIKLNGSGTAEYRAIRFKAAGAAKLTVYLNSSSKTDARILKVVRADGTTLAELTAPPDEGIVAGIATFDLPSAGSYVLFSAGSGINIYQIIVD